MKYLPGETGADFSDCGRYRYRLWRWWREGPALVWVGLNPSTADGDTDDPTIRRVADFSERAGFGGLMMVNLFALRATDPKVLLTTPHPLTTNASVDVLEAEIKAGAAMCGARFRARDGSIQVVNGMVVAAWGSQPQILRQMPGVTTAVKAWAGDKLRCLGTTKDGSPRHPLYLPKSAEFVPWPVK